MTSTDTLFFFTMIMFIGILTYRFTINAICARLRGSADAEDAMARATRAYLYRDIAFAIDGKEQPRAHSR